MPSAFPYRTAIDTAAASKDLTIKATVKAELNITVTTYDDQIDTHIHQASALIEGYCNRPFGSEQVTDYFRTETGDSPDKLRLSRKPIITIDEIVEGSTTLDIYDYELSAATGELWRLDGGGDRTTWASGSQITVQYSAGYALLTTLPHDVERACIDQVKAMFMSRQRDPTLKSESLPDTYQVSYALAGGDFIGVSGLLISVEGALAPYRRMVIA